MKEKGNVAFKEGRYQEALELFSEGIALDSSNFLLWSNRSATYLKLGEFGKALKDANTVISLNPQFAKGYIRKGNTFLSLKSWKEAAHCFEDGLKIEPENKELIKGREIALFSLQCSNVIKDGIWVPVPIAYSTEKPFPIRWDLYASFSIW
uniref:Uncharacterized protein n=1 Tax=Arcella intermedia TaxID=1963864 RepID=A0A6B2LPP8_9EUKA